MAVWPAKVAHALRDRVAHAWGVVRLSRSQSRAAALATEAAAAAVAAALAAVLMLRLSVPRDDDGGD